MNKFGLKPQKKEKMVCLLEEINNARIFITEASSGTPFEPTLHGENALPVLNDDNMTLFSTFQRSSEFMKAALSYKVAASWLFKAD